MTPHMRGGMDLALDHVVSGSATASSNNPTLKDVVIDLGGSPAILALAPF